MNINNENLKKQIESIPTHLAAFALSEKWNSDLKTIVSNHSLSDDQTTNLENELFIILIGLEPAKDFTRNIAKTLNLDPEKAVLIAEEVNSEIFEEVREDLTLIQESLENAPEEAPLQVPSEAEQREQQSPEQPAPPKARPSDGGEAEETEEPIPSNHIPIKYGSNQTEKATTNDSQNKPQSRGGTSLDEKLSKIASLHNKHQNSNIKDESSEPADRSDPYREPIE